MANEIAGDIFLNIARGKEGFSYVHKFGHTPNASTTSNPVWVGGAYTYLTTAKYLKVASDDTNDDSASTGAKNVTIYGVGAGYTSQSETIAMGGFVGVTSASQYLRIFRISVDTSGSSGFNEGAINILPDEAGSTFTAVGVPTATANILATIETTTSQTEMAMYTVPLSYTAYLYNTWGSCSEDNAIEITRHHRPVGRSFLIKERLHVYRTLINLDHKIPIPIASKTDIELRALGSTSSADVSAGFDLILIEN